MLLDWGQNQDGTDVLKSVFDIKDDTTIFDNPKPVSLISNLIKSTMIQEPVVLDFFAGSGTTGHAVLDLGLENAQFILCQLNEITDSTPNGIAYDVTAKRLKRIMTGECYDGTTNFDWINKNKPYGGNLDVYEIATVANFESTKGKSPFEVIDETLYGQKRFERLEDKVKWVCENFNNTQKQVEE